MLQINAREIEGVMDDPEKLTTMGTQDTRRRQTNQKTQHNMCWTPIYVNKQK